MKDYYFKVKNAVCSICADETNTLDKVINVITKIYPKETEDFLKRKGIPSNNPFIAEWEKQWEEHEVKCLVFEYDDCQEAICKKHLQEILEQL